MKKLGIAVVTLAFVLTLAGCSDVEDVISRLGLPMANGQNT